MTPPLHRPQQKSPLSSGPPAPVESLRKIRYETTLQALPFAPLASFAVKYLPSFPLGSPPVAMTPPFHRPEHKSPLRSGPLLRSNLYERSATKPPCKLFPLRPSRPLRLNPLLAHPSSSPPRSDDAPASSTPSISPPSPLHLLPLFGFIFHSPFSFFLLLLGLQGHLVPNLPFFRDYP
jgi:hypothetical protein